MTLADRLIVMNEGRFEQIGTPIQVYEQPATTFVAGFIGSPAMNFLEAQTAEPHRLLLSGNVTLELESEHKHLLDYAGKTVLMGIRPEHLTVTTEDAARFGFQVDFIEALGADTVVHGAIEKEGPPLTIRVPGVMKVARGDLLPMTFEPRHLHLFDPETRQRI
ncbi:MAG: TOBE domain-containing protein [Thermodesulfobacteriota bacterium]